ncbi:unnamed protein product, partial [Ectocarpus sp. 12 AP-2014]
LAHGTTNPGKLSGGAGASCRSRNKHAVCVHVFLQDGPVRHFNERQRSKKPVVRYCGDHRCRAFAGFYPGQPGGRNHQGSGNSCSELPRLVVPHDDSSNLGMLQAFNE